MGNSDGRSDDENADKNADSEVQAHEVPYGEKDSWELN
jgi:hypothetical protein